MGDRLLDETVWAFAALRFRSQVGPDIWDANVRRSGTFDVTHTILVTGGAGYVGSHVCLALARVGHRVVAFDNLSNGHADFVKWGVLEQGDVRDRTRLREVFAAHRPSAVVHCAALIEVGVSVKDPASFYDVNVSGSLALLDVMRHSGAPPIVFSSTCATYGAPVTIPMLESHPQVPISPYGRSKLMVEQAVRDYESAYGQKFALLRYFNAAGAASEENIGERHDPETHVIPLALFALLGRRDAFRIFGDDYDTRDGTCLRDYVHVLDLADAHVRAVARLVSGGESVAANLGTGRGVTVRELVTVIEEVTSQTLPVLISPRRPGDAAALLADATLARRELGWSPQYDIQDIIRSAWDWHRRGSGKH